MVQHNQVENWDDVTDSELLDGIDTVYDILANAEESGMSECKQAMNRLIHAHMVEEAQRRGILLTEEQWGHLLSERKLLVR